MRKLKPGALLQPIRETNISTYTLMLLTAEAESQGAYVVQVRDGCVRPGLQHIADLDDYCFIGYGSAGLINAAQYLLGGEQDGGDGLVSHQVRAAEGETLYDINLGCGLVLLHMGVGCTAVDLCQKVRTRPENGEFRDELGEMDNPSYGWQFFYDAEQQLWKAHRRMSDGEVSRAIQLVGWMNSTFDKPWSQHQPFGQIDLTKFI